MFLTVEGPYCDVLRVAVHEPSQRFNCIGVFVHLGAPCVGTIAQVAHLSEVGHDILPHIHGDDARADVAHVLSEPPWTVDGRVVLEGAVARIHKRLVESR